MSLALDLVDTVLEKTEGMEVRRVILEVGTLSCVVPQALAGAFELCVEGTRLASARLEIVSIPGAGRCRDCGAEVPLEGPVGVCACGSRDLAWLRGQDLRLKAVEVV